ncbi:hypothetical protein [Gemmatimonas aurantiaca]|uniref:hypothetical protein n=1 Tax=Gemmatimonas aurantiaca TaxID=173480 RepID=UPI00301BF14E
MSEDSPEPTADRKRANNVSAEIEAFTKVVAALHDLDDEGRIKLLRTVATFLGIDAFNASPTAAIPAGRHPAATSAPSSIPVPAGNTGGFSEDRAMSPKEFLLDKRPIQDIERIACLAYYLTHYRDTPHFKTLDLSKLNTEAAQVKFSNAAQAVDNATKAGLLVPAAKGTKQISAKGELYVQALPDRAAAKDAIAHFRQRRKVRRGRSGGGSQNSSSEAYTGESEE